MRTDLLAMVCLCAVGVLGCSSTRLAKRLTTQMILRAEPTYARETDYELAEQALASHLKLVEGLLELNPRHPDLLVVAASGFARYAFGFVETPMDLAAARDDLPERDRLAGRAIRFYTRARDYGVRALSRHWGYPDPLSRGPQALSIALKALDHQALPALFWTAYAWGNLIQLQQEVPARLSELPAVVMMMSRVLAIDEGFYFGGAHLFLGAYWGSRPLTLGGSLVKANKHLQRGIDLSQGKYLPAQLLFAIYYAIPAQERALFESKLHGILGAPPDLFPEQALANEIAKRRAAHWLQRSDALFF